MTAKAQDKQDSPNAFTQSAGVIHLGGIDALVRLALDQVRTDEAPVTVIGHAPRARGARGRIRALRTASANP